MSSFMNVESAAREARESAARARAPAPRALRTLPPCPGVPRRAAGRRRDNAFSAIRARMFLTNAPITGAW